MLLGCNITMHPVIDEKFTQILNYNSLWDGGDQHECITWININWSIDQTERRTLWNVGIPRKFLKFIL